MNRKPNNSSEQLQARKLLQELRPFAQLRKRVTSVDAIRCFLSVANEEGMNVTHHAKTLDISTSTASRNLLDLGARDRYMNEGLGLVEGHENPTNLLQRLYYLTAKGRDLLAEVNRGAK